MSHQLRKRDRHFVFHFSRWFRLRSQKWRQCGDAASLASPAASAPNNTACAVWNGERVPVWFDIRPGIVFLCQFHTLAVGFLSWPLVWRIARRIIAVSRLGISERIITVGASVLRRATWHGRAPIHYSITHWLLACARRPRYGRRRSQDGDERGGAAAS